MYFNLIPFNSTTACMNEFIWYWESFGFKVIYFYWPGGWWELRMRAGSVWPALLLDSMDLVRLVGEMHHFKLPKNLQQPVWEGRGSPPWTTDRMGLRFSFLTLQRTYTCSTPCRIVPGLVNSTIFFFTTVSNSICPSKINLLLCSPETSEVRCRL